MMMAMDDCDDDDDDGDDGDDDDDDDRVDEGLLRFKGAEVGGITFLTKVHEGEIVTSH